MPDRAAGAFGELAANRIASTSMRAMSLLYTARVHDVSGRRAEAIKVYEQVIDRYEKEQYAANLARAGLLAPYRRRVALGQLPTHERDQLGKLARVGEVAAVGMFEVAALELRRNESGFGDRNQRVV